MYKNWNAICGCEDKRLLMLLAVSENPQTLAGLQKGFPQFFTAEEQVDPKVPMSAFRELVKHRGEKTVTDICEKLGIPLFLFGDHEQDIGPIPKKWEKYHGRVFGDGRGVRRLMYSGETCLVLECSVPAYMAIASERYFDVWH